MQINRMIFTTIVVAALTLCSCGGGDDAQSTDNSGQGGGSITGNTELSFTANTTDLLRNPMNGWVMYVSGSADPSYFDRQIYLSELGKNVYVRDYASACYIRTGWKSLNPADGKYAWEDPSTPIYKLVARAEELGLPIAFRVVVDGRDQRENTPQFVFDAGAEYWLENDRYPDRKTPLAMDPIWRQYYEKFVRAFAQRFNNVETTAFIDAYGLGKWGEGHNVCYEQGNAITDKTVEYKANTMEWITRLYADNFTEVPLVINYHRQLGHPVSSGKNAQPDSEALLAIAIRNGYCLRSDAIGMNNAEWGYNSWEKAFARTWNYKLPILMEGGWIVSQHSYWNDDKKYRRDHPEDVRQGEFDDSKEARVNMMDFRVGDETESWFKTSFNLVKRFIAEGGYRLYPDKVSLPSAIKGGQTATIGHRWRNVGWGYLPNNLQQWNYKYKVAFALLDRNGEPVQVFVDKECEPSHWQEGNPYDYRFNVSPSVSAGEYTWGVAIVNTRDDNKPGIKLALSSKPAQSGWIALSKVRVD
ncbi:DUF4832 domain-containing protein [Muribaculum intestinale]|uniref:DUF4832 domain-containing protein n=1 Tax=Muribaculum intestinale TaxID=1796646 RepID=UPI0025AA2E2E|nr:DUF4832 domain-containing protein [Muribaculum intestinale]